MIKEFKIITNSGKETIRLGQSLGSLLTAGDVVGLVGELGSGKTWLTKGIALGLGVDPATVVTSPSFALVNEYEGKVTLYHIDVYRLGNVAEFISAGLEEYLYAGGVVVLEWADRWPEILPENSIRVELSIPNENERLIKFAAIHPRAVQIIESLRA